MVTRIGGARRKTRYMLKKEHSAKGKINITRYLQEFTKGDQVQLVAEPAVQKGIYFRRFHGKHGKVIGKQGECYMVSLFDQNKAKRVIVHPIHLKSVGVKND